jgi:hypothetical protein
MSTNFLPKLRKVDNSDKMFHYKLSDPFSKRKLAIDEGICKGAKKYGSIKSAALKKKARLNILRIYRRYRKPKECQIITNDMKYIDKMYLKDGITKNIC